mgnify:CR=1 FL=1
MRSTTPDHVHTDANSSEMPIFAHDNETTPMQTPLLDETDRQTDSTPLCFGGELTSAS